MPSESTDIYSKDTNATAVLGNTTATLVPVVGQELVRIGSNAASTITNLAALAPTLLPTLGILGTILKSKRSRGADLLSQDVIDAMELNDFALDELKYLFKEGNVSPNGRFPNGQTLLMRAVDLSLIEVVEFLLEKGADVYLKDDLGDTVMMYIHFTNPSGKKIADLLLKHGASACEENTRGHSLSSKIDSEFSSPEFLKALKKCNPSLSPGHSL